MATTHPAERGEYSFAPEETLPIDVLKQMADETDHAVSQRAAVEAINQGLADPLYLPGRQYWHTRQLAAVMGYTTQECRDPEDAHQVTPAAALRYVQEAASLASQAADNHDAEALIALSRTLLIRPGQAMPAFWRDQPERPAHLIAQYAAQACKELIAARQHRLLATALDMGQTIVTEPPVTRTVPVLTSEVNHQDTVEAADAQARYDTMLAIEDSLAAPLQLDGPAFRQTRRIVAIAAYCSGDYTAADTAVGMTKQQATGYVREIEKLIEQIPRETDPNTARQSLAALITLLPGQRMPESWTQRPQPYASTMERVMRTYCQQALHDIESVAGSQRPDTRDQQDIETTVTVGIKRHRLAERIARSKFVRRVIESFGNLTWY